MASQAIAAAVGVKPKPSRHDRRAPLRVGRCHDRARRRVPRQRGEPLSQAALKGAIPALGEAAVNTLPDVDPEPGHSVRGSHSIVLMLDPEQVTVHRTPPNTARISVPTHASSELDLASSNARRRSTAKSTSPRSWPW